MSDNGRTCVVQRSAWGLAVGMCRGGCNAVRLESLTYFDAGSIGNEGPENGKTRSRS